MSKLSYIRTIEEGVPFKEKRFVLNDESLPDDKVEKLKALTEKLHGVIPEGYTLIDYKPAKVVFRKYDDCTGITDVQATTE